MNALTFWKVLLGVVATVTAFIAFKLKVPPFMIGTAGLSAYAGTAILSLFAFLLLPKNRKLLAVKVLAVIGLGFLVHRFMNDVDQGIRKK